MARGRCTFRQRDLAAVLRAAKKAGVDVDAKITADGIAIRFSTASANDNQPPAANDNYWDKVLK